MIMVVSAALAFAVCGFGGKHAGERLCRDRVPFDDGPRPSGAPVWLFAALAAAVGAALALHGSTVAEVVGTAFVVLALAAGAAADLRCGIIPDSCTLLPLGAIAVVAIWRHDAAPLLGAAFVAIPLAIAAFFTNGRGIGWGDVKLAAFAGAALGGRDAVVALFGAFLAVFLWSVLRRQTAQPAAFAPYFAAAVAAGIGMRSTW
jgi:prepilin signal peptidase PulO-like enzyme (type II secretory pathway)